MAEEQEQEQEQQDDNSGKREFEEALVKSCPGVEEEEG